MEHYNLIVWLHGMARLESEFKKYDINDVTELSALKYVKVIKSHVTNI